MSVVQTPPVTVITLPPASTVTTEVTTTTITTPTTLSSSPTTAGTSSVTTAVPTQTSGVDDAGQAGAGPAVLLVLVLVAVISSIFGAIRRRRSTPAVVVPPGPSLTERVRAAVDRAERGEQDDHYDMDDVSVADLYPWVTPPDDLTLVVDLRTAEALQEAGVTSLDQLAHIDNDMVRSMIAAGIDIDTGALEAAAQDILGRRREVD